MDSKLIQHLLEGGILDFDKLVLSEYKNLNLSDQEAMLLIHLHKEVVSGQTKLNVERLSNQFAITSDQAYIVLDRLLQGGFLTLSIHKNEEGKESETFHVEETAVKMMLSIEKRLSFQMAAESKQYETPEEAVVDFVEQAFQKQLTPIELEIIQKWLSESQYDLLQIKQALYDAVKANKPSLSYMDALLLRKKKKIPKDKQQTTYEPKPEALKNFFDSWKKD